jgi:DNA-binding LacI/PurR family transcriptional regulator
VRSRAIPRVRPGPAAPGVSRLGGGTCGLLEAEGGPLVAVEVGEAALGFVRNESARQLRAGRSRTIGLVVLDYGGELAAGHLAERGQRRIAFVGGSLGIKQVQDRFDGARRALLEAGLPESALTVVETPALNFPSGLAAGAQIASMPAGSRPTAAFCANDLLAWACSRR